MTTVKELQKLLGTESGTAWLNFMDHVKAELSQVLKAGKPRQIDIENSIIGQNGFSSWKEMIESPTDQKGLGWNYSTFDMWKRAYNVVLKFPFLRSQEELTPSLINTIWRETKPNFPDSAENLALHMEKRTSKQRDKQQNSLKDAQKRNDELTKQLEARERELALLRIQVAQIEDLKGTNAALNIENGKLVAQLEAKEEELSIAKGEVNKKSTLLTTERTNHKNTIARLKVAEMPVWKRIWKRWF